MSPPADRRKRLVLGALAAVVVALVVAILWSRPASRQPGAAGGRPSDAGVAAPATPTPAVRRSDFATPPADALRLVGQVVDARGAPVPGAGVLLTGDASRETRADGAGGFVFEGLWAGPYLVEAWSGDAAGGPLRVHLGRDTPKVVVRLFAAARVAIKVVSAPTQHPLAGADVELRAQGMTRNHVTIRRGKTDARGVLELRGVPPGGYLVAAWAPGHRMAAVNLKPRAGLSWETTVTLTPGSEVRARILDEDGAPVAGAAVWGTPYLSGDLVQISRPPPFAFTARSDARGDVTAVVLAGRNRLMVDHERYVLGWSEPFDADGASPVQGVVVRLQRGGVIAGTVVTADQRPVPRALVRVSPSNAQEVHGAVRQVVCDAQGRFEMAGVPLTGMELAAFADGATSETYALDLGQNREQRRLVVALTLEGSIGGVVVGSDGNPLGDVEVQCTSYQREAVALRPAAVETTDAAGRFACRGLRPGEYRVRAIPPGSNNMVQAAMRGVGTDAQTGQQDLRLVIRADGSLSGRVQLPDGRPATEFRIELVTGLEGRLFESRDGAFVVEGIPPVGYDLKVTVAGLPPKQVSARVAERQNSDLGVIRLDRDGPAEPKPLPFPSPHEFVPAPAPPTPTAPTGEDLPRPSRKQK
jgi:protocatechuate 3,4-dioxygenase beta subunit